MIRPVYKKQLRTVVAPTIPTRKEMPVLFTLKFLRNIDQELDGSDSNPYSKVHCLSR